MKILWIVNMTFPEVYKCLNKGGGELKATGGWLLGASDSLISEDNIELRVASVSSLVDKFTIIKGEKIIYYVLPIGKGNYSYNKGYNKFWIKINSDFKPDIVHIHGSEFAYGLAFVKSCGNRNVVISIQGVSYMIARYYFAGLKFSDIIKNITLRDLLKGTLFKEKTDFRKRGNAELQLFKEVSYAIGRTKFDKDHYLWTNPKGVYYVGNETLRKEFYSDKWCYSNCTPRTIFVSQFNFAIKGAHIFLLALKLVLTRYPDTRVRIGGVDVTKSNSSFFDRLKLSGYGKMLKKIIRKNALENHITFLGSLDAEEMKREYLNCNVYVCSSSCENSPNSLCEAQILGVPNVSSYVGGIPDLVPNSDCGRLYRFEEYEMLASIICELFETSKELDNTFMIQIARERHDPQKNCKIVLDIYKQIVSQQK